MRRKGAENSLLAPTAASLAGELFHVLDLEPLAGSTDTPRICRRSGVLGLSGVKHASGNDQEPTHRRACHEPDTGRNRHIIRGHDGALAHR